MQPGSRTPGSEVQVAGFKDLTSSEQLEVNKLVAKWVTRFSEICDRLELLKVSMKKVREKEKSEIYEMHALLQDHGRTFAAKIADRDLFFALDHVLKKLEAEIRK